MNKKQRLILAIFIPIIIFFIALIIANIVGVTVTVHTGISFDTTDTGRMTNFRSSGPSYDTYRHEPFDWQKTWYVWFLALIFCCFFEYKLFADKKIKGTKNNEK
jgi:hypothetical protein